MSRIHRRPSGKLRLSRVIGSRVIGLVAIFTVGCSGSTASPTTPVSEREPGPAPDLVSETNAETPSRRAVAIENVKASGSFLAPLPRAVTSFGAAATESAFYILGGYSGTPHEYSKEGQSTDVMKLDLKEGEIWEKVASLSQGLQGLAAIHHDGKICHIGGNQASNEKGTEAHMTSVKTARCLDLKTSQWITLPDLPQGRSSHGAAVIGGKVYVAGGWTLAGAATTGTFVEDVLVLDLTKPGQSWEVIPAPFSRRAVGVAAARNKLVIVGGMTSDGKVSTEVDVYDTDTKEWKKGPVHPGDAFGVGVTGDAGVVYAAGREGILRSYKPGDASWTKVSHLGFARFFHEMRVSGNELVVVGGIGGMHTRGRTSIVERRPLDGSLTYGQLSFSTPGAAKNRQGFLLQGEEVYLFGGNVSLEQHDFERKHFTSEGWKLDLATLKFVEAASYPYRRQSMQNIETDGGGLSLGGFGHEPLEEENSEAISQEQIFSYSWESDSWKAAGQMPRGRTQFGLARSSGKLWVFGGLNYDPLRKNAFEHDETIWTADEKTLDFEVSDLLLPGPRRAFAGAELGGKYYLVGGMKEGFQLVDDCLEFDFETRLFARIPCPAPRLSGDLVAAGGKLYLVGGSVKTKDGIEESRTVEMFDPELRKWTKLDFEIPFSTRHMRALAFREQILLLSTHFEEPKMTVGLLSP